MNRTLRPWEQNTNTPDAGAAQGMGDRLEAAIRAQTTQELARSPAALQLAKKEHATPPILSRANPRDTAKLLLNRYTIENVSRLRFQDETFWLWNGKAYKGQSAETIRKLVGDFLYEARCRTNDGALVSFNPKTRDVNEVIDALKMEALLEGVFRAPCWLPGGEPAREWIVFRNGILNANTGQLISHTHKLWAHGALLYDWQPEAECPVFDSFVRSIWPDDPDAWELVEAFAGYCMTLEIWAHKGLLLLGEPRAGKGTLIRLLAQLVGQESFGSYFFDSWLRSESAPHGLIGKRVIAFPDTRLKEGKYFGQVWDAGGLPHTSKEMLLRITGGDSHSFRKPYTTEFWQGVLPGKVIIASNEPPNFNDPVLPTRFLKLNFTRNFEKEGKLDPLMGEKLEAELPGIAVRCLKAYWRAKLKGQFVQPESGLVLERQLARARHPMLAMVRECLELSDNADDWVSKGEAERACKAWLKENGHSTMAMVLRSEEMGEKLVAAFDHLKSLKPRERFIQRKADGKRYWVRLRLSAEGRRLVEESL